MCAASVYPEPGSNSHVIQLPISFVLLCQTSVKISSMYTEYYLVDFSSSSLHNLLLETLYNLIISNQIFFWVLSSIFYAFAFLFFGSFTTALLVSQSLLFTFQCAFTFFSILLKCRTHFILLLLDLYVNTFLKLF